MSPKLARIFHDCTGMLVLSSQVSAFFHLLDDAWCTSNLFGSDSFHRFAGKVNQINFFRGEH